MTREAEKVAIRRAMRLERAALSPSRRVCAAEAAERAVLACGEALRTVAVYLATPQEIDLTSAIASLLQRGVRVVAPRWNGSAYDLAVVKGLSADDLQAGPMNVLEPREGARVSPREVTLWIVPGLAFTRTGDRLGYGGGWYDRLLAGASEEAEKIAFAYPFQVVESLPHEAHDIRLNRVIVV